VKAAYIEGNRIVLREVPEPTPGPGEVVVEVRYALTDGTDLKALLRGHHLIGEGPFGHEYAGVIWAVGEGVEDFREGDEVVGANTAPCFGCRMCRIGRYNLCENLSRNMVLGAYAQHLKIPAAVVRTNLYHKPPEIPFKYAPMLEPLACAVHGLEVLDLNGYERVLVVGTGSIASFFILLFKMTGHRVAVLGRNPEKLKVIAENLNPDEVLDYSASIGRYDVVVESTGRREVWESVLNYTDRGGKILLFGGLPEGTHVAFDAHRLHYEEIHLLTSFHHTPLSVRRALHILREHWEKLAFLVSGEFPLERIGEAFELMRRGKGFKYAIKP